MTVAKRAMNMVGDIVKNCFDLAKYISTTYRAVDGKNTEPMISDQFAIKISSNVLCTKTYCLILIKLKTKSNTPLVSPTILQELFTF